MTHEHQTSADFRISKIQTGIECYLTGTRVTDNNRYPGTRSDHQSSHILHCFWWAVTEFVHLNNSHANFVQQTGIFLPTNFCLYMAKITLAVATVSNYRASKGVGPVRYMSISVQTISVHKII